MEKISLYSHGGRFPTPVLLQLTRNELNIFYCDFSTFKQYFTHESRKGRIWPSQYFNRFSTFSRNFQKTLCFLLRSPLRKALKVFTNVKLFQEMPLNFPWSQQNSLPSSPLSILQKLPSHL